MKADGGGSSYSPPGTRALGPSSQDLAATWPTWDGRDSAHFVSSLCGLPQYGKCAVQNLTGVHLKDLHASGFISKGLSRAGIQDFDHLKRIGGVIQRLERGGSLENFQPWREPPQTSTGRADRNCRHLLRQGLGGFCPACDVRRRANMVGAAPTAYTSSLWEEERPWYPSRSCSSSHLLLPPLKQRAARSKLSPSAISRFALSRPTSPPGQSLTTTLMQKSVSEGSLTCPFFSVDRLSPEPWGGLSSPPSHAQPQERERWRRSQRLADSLRTYEVLSGEEQSRIRSSVGRELSDLIASSEEEVEDARARNQALVAKMKFLAQVPLMKRLPKDQLPILASACVKVDYDANDLVIRMGEVGDQFFVLESGEANVIVDGAKVATLKRGDYFGEYALLNDKPRSATVVARTRLECFVISRQKFQELGLHSKLRWPLRRAFAVGFEKPVEAMEASPKTAEERRLIVSAIQKNTRLLNAVSLSDEQVNQMADVAWKEVVEAGNVLTNTGDTEAKHFYIVQEGSFEVALARRSKEAPRNLEKAMDGEAKVIPTLGRGDSFGELALLYGGPRTATVQARERSVVWLIERQNFKHIVQRGVDQKTMEYVRYIQDVEIFTPLLYEEKVSIARALVEMRFSKGEAVITQGETGNALFIVFDGEVEVVKDGASIAQLVANPALKQAHYFAERALLENAVHNSTVAVTSEDAKAFVLDRESINMLLGPLRDIINEESPRNRAMIRSPEDIRATVGAKPTDHILRGDLTKLRLLGCGGFGAVTLVEHRLTGKTFALKAVSKGFVVEKAMTESILNEKSILLTVDSPFIITLHECYLGAQSVYFLLDAALGGELYATYKREGFEGNVAYAKYYIGSVVFAFEYLHARHVVYRDLKPENLLLMEDGHCKLTDMGLAKFVIGKTFTVCGTPDYFAPELISSTGHNHALDWWTVGILLFELMAGYPPFESDTPSDIYGKVMDGIGMVLFPPSCGGPCGDLINALLQQEPTMRLPMRAGGAQNIKDHAWYEGFAWEALRSLEMEPPYKPTVKSPTDASNFGNRDIDLPTRLEYRDDGSGWDDDFATVEEDLAPSEPPEHEPSEGSGDLLEDLGSFDEEELYKLLV